VKPKLGRAWAAERGEGMVSALLLLAGALLPLLFLIVLFGRIEQAKLVVTQAASASVRAAVLAPSEPAAQAAAAEELAAAQAQSAASLSLRLAGSFSRGGLLEADVSAALPLGELPFFGAVGTITIEASARAPVDAYRSFPGAS